MKLLETYTNINGIGGEMVCFKDTKKISKEPKGIKTFTVLLNRPLNAYSMPVFTGKFGARGGRPRPCVGSHGRSLWPHTHGYERSTSGLWVTLNELHHPGGPTGSHLHPGTTSHREPGEDVGVQLKSNFILRKTISHGVTQLP